MRKRSSHGVVLLGRREPQCGWTQRTRIYGLAQLQERRTLPHGLKMPWARFITILCTLRLPQCSVCKLEITPASQNLLWGWPCPHITFLGIHKSPSSSYGFRFKITRNRKENVSIRQLLLSALLQSSPWTKQNKNPQYLLSPCRKKMQQEIMQMITSKSTSPDTFMYCIDTIHCIYTKMMEQFLSNDTLFSSHLQTLS